MLTAADETRARILASSPISTGQSELDSGTAGASARREHERRKANREQRVRDKHPRIGGLVLALSDEPQHQPSWARGADGEEHVAQSLAKHLDPSVVVLHDRWIPPTRANIDHMAIAPTGVWVIDAKRYTGKVAVSKPIFGHAKLTIAGRDKSKLVDGLAKQVGLVQDVMATLAAEVAVRGALCFVDSELSASLPHRGPAESDGCVVGSRARRCRSAAQVRFHVEER